METMMAMMIVTIAMSSFMVAFAYTNVEEPDNRDVSIDFLDSLRIEDGRIVGFDRNYTVDESERMGYRSMKVFVKTVGGIYDIGFVSGVETDGCDQVIRNGTLMLVDENGARCAAVYEVIAFV